MKNREIRLWLIWVVLVPVILLMVPVQARAFELGGIGFYITNETLFNYNKLAEDGENNQFYESLSIFCNYGKWSMGLTLRANNFLKQMPNDTLENAEFDVYRKYVEYNSKHWKIHAGDFYSLLGHGLVLSVLKNEDIYRERTLLGGNVHFNKGRWDVRVLGGRIKDETYSQEWFAAGGEAAFEFVKDHTAGVHFSYIDDVEAQFGMGKRFTYSVSLRGNRLFKNVGYYAEFAVLNFEDPGREQGYGFYSTVTYSKSHFTGFLEFKRYSHFDNEMNNPPLADRTEEISTMNDAVGARVFLQYSFFEPDIQLFFNVGRYEEYGEVGNHVYGGVNIEDLWDRLSFSVSYGVRDILYPVRKFDGHLIYRFSDRLSVELSMKDKRYRDDSFIFRETDHSFQVSYSPYVSVFVLHQYSHNRVMHLNHFYSGGIKVYFRSGTVVEVSGGTVRGGQVCSGGQCFVAPPFKGIKFSLLHTFK